MSVRTRINSYIIFNVHVSSSAAIYYKSTFVLNLKVVNLAQDRIKIKLRNCILDFS